MNSLIAILLIATIGAASCLSDVHQSCLDQNKEPLSNDYLLGQWYEMYKFTLFATLVPSLLCTELNFTRATTDDIQLYKEKYNSADLPYSFDDNPIIRRREGVSGMTMGNSMAKFLVLAPNSAVVLNEGYAVYSYRPLNDNFIMFSDCAMRGNIRWLLARNRDASVEEMDKLISETPELKYMAKQRFCAN